jgi:predicted RNase H-like nuclease (RuvC/YqgF family)
MVTVDFCCDKCGKISYLSAYCSSCGPQKDPKEDHKEQIRKREYEICRLNLKIDSLESELAMARDIIHRLERELGKPERR